MYSDTGFKKTFRVSMATFWFILRRMRIEHGLTTRHYRVIYFVYLFTQIQLHRWSKQNENK